MLNDGLAHEDKLLDTELIRRSYRYSIRSAIALCAIAGMVYALWYYLIGIDIWIEAVAYCIGMMLLYPLTGDGRSAKVFLAATLACTLISMLIIASLVYRLGLAAGFQYLFFVVLPSIILSGRIGLRVKWILIFGLIGFFISVERFSLNATPSISLSHRTIALMHGINIASSIVLLAYLIQNYFIDIAEIQRRLNKLAWIDPLTDLLNRRRLVEIAEVEFKKSDRHGTPVSIIMADVDHFKSINDDHGHEEGDAVLLRISRFIKRMTRDSDSICRWGGEEFLVLMPHTDLHRAMFLAERMRSHINQELHATGKAEIQISLTLGVAERQFGECLEMAVQRADKALYEGKSAGRNRVESAV